MPLSSPLWVDGCIALVAVMLLIAEVIAFIIPIAPPFTFLHFVLLVEC
jgi:hypothetical protein